MLEKRLDQASSISAMGNCGESGSGFGQDSTVCLVEGLAHYISVKSPPHRVWPTLLFSPSLSHETMPSPKDRCPAPRRRTIACTECRHHKVCLARQLHLACLSGLQIRCDAHLDYTKPCYRCRRMNRECKLLEDPTSVSKSSVPKAPSQGRPIPTVALTVLTKIKENRLIPAAPTYLGRCRQLRVASYGA